MPECRTAARCPCWRQHHDEKTQALHIVLDLALLNLDRMYDIRNPVRAPDGGWWGRWDTDGTEIAIVPDRFKAELDDRGIEWMPIMRRLKIESWATMTDSTWCSPVRIGDQRKRCARFPMEAFIEALDANPNTLREPRARARAL